MSQVVSLDDRANTYNRLSLGAGHGGCVLKAAVWASRLRWSAIVVVVSLMLIGCTAIARADALSSAPGRMFQRQVVWCLVSLTAMFVATLPNYRALCRWAYGFYALIMLLLLVVYLFPPVNGSHRWIRFGGIGLQPSEFAKIAFVLALGRYVMLRQSHRRLLGLAAPLGLTLLPVLLILREPDLGTAMLFLPVLFCMLFAAGARSGNLATLALVGVCLSPIVWLQMSREQRSRVTALVHQTKPGDHPTGDRYHLHQAKQMMALGGAWGSFLRGDAVEDRAAYHLPESQTDFIVCVVTERYGMFGTTVVLGLLVALVWQSLAIAAATREPFGRIIAVGFASLIGVQTAINTAMTVGLAPITGLSLPLVSYGGSGLLAHAMALGLLLNIGLRPGFEVAKDPYRFLNLKRSPPSRLQHTP